MQKIKKEKKKKKVKVQLTQLNFRRQNINSFLKYAKIKINNRQIH